MPTTRRFRGHVRFTFGPLEHEHLETGPDHLLADGPGVECWICAHGIEAARNDWKSARAVVLANWDRLEMPFPPLGAILFDGEKLPPLNPMWRDLHRSTWHVIADELAVLADA